MRSVSTVVLEKSRETHTQQAINEARVAATEFTVSVIVGGLAVLGANSAKIGYTLTGIGFSTLFMKLASNKLEESRLHRSYATDCNTAIALHTGRVDPRQQ